MNYCVCIWRNLEQLRLLLQEVITLTGELVDSHTTSTLTHSPGDDDDDDDDGDETGTAAGSSARAEAEARAWLASDVTWKTGDKCRAIWSDNHQYVALFVISRPN